MKLGKRMVAMMMALTTVATMIGSAGAVSYSGVNIDQWYFAPLRCSQTARKIFRVSDKTNRTAIWQVQHLMRTSAWILNFTTITIPA